MSLMQHFSWPVMKRKSDRECLWVAIADWRLAHGSLDILWWLMEDIPVNDPVMRPPSTKRHGLLHIFACVKDD